MVPGALPLQAQLAVRGGVVHTVSGAAIQDGVVLVGADGRIQGVGPSASVDIPDGYRVLEAAVVTPGLVDARTVVGLSGIMGGTLGQEQLETSSPMQPQLRAFDAYNARDPLVEWVRDRGTTTLHTGHGPGALISGQTMVVKSHGTAVGEVLVDSLTAYAATLGAEAVRTGGGWPGTRARGVAMLRGFLLRAQQATDRERVGAQGTELAQEEAGRILRGEVPLMITAHRAQDILAALRLAEEFGFRLILDGAAEAPAVLDEIRAAGVPVILHPTMARHQGALENASFETARHLAEAGILFAIPSGHEPYFPKTRVLLMEGAMAAGYGLPFDRTLRAITLDAARILGVEGRVGSLEVGKDGDLVLFDGDPFEYTTHVCAVVIEGRVVSDVCR
jgi:imidazolonepropionase-like amidohydrolase